MSRQGLRLHTVSFFDLNGVRADYSSHAGDKGPKRSQQPEPRTGVTAPEPAAGSTQTSQSASSRRFLKGSDTESLPGNSTLATIVTINEKEFPSVFLAPKLLLIGRKKKKTE